MNYIIDPMVFYWIEVIGALGIALPFAFIVSTGVFVILFFTVSVHNDLFEIEESSKPYRQDGYTIFGNLCNVNKETEDEYQERLKNWELKNKDAKEQLNKKIFKAIKYYLIPAILSFILLISSVVFIPTKDTMYKMLVAKYATVDNVEVGVETIKDTIDYIVEKIGELK